MTERKKFGDDPLDRFYVCPLEKSLAEMPIIVVMFVIFASIAAAAVGIIAIVCLLVDLFSAGGW